MVGESEVLDVGRAPGPAPGRRAGSRDDRSRPRGVRRPGGRGQRHEPFDLLVDRLGQGEGIELIAQGHELRHRRGIGLSTRLHPLRRRAGRVVPPVQARPGNSRCQCSTFSLRFSDKMRHLLSLLGRFSMGGLRDRRGASWGWEGDSRLVGPAGEGLGASRSDVEGRGGYHPIPPPGPIPAPRTTPPAAACRAAGSCRP